MKINKKYLIAIFTVLIGTFFLQACTEDLDIISEYSIESLATPLMTRSSETIYLVTVQDNILYPFEIELSSLREGVYKNTYKATVKVVFDHDKATGKPRVNLLDYIAPANYTINGVSISKDLFDGRYKLSATGKDRNGIDCSGTYAYPILIADIPILSPEEDDSINNDSDSLDCSDNCNEQ